MGQAVLRIHQHQGCEFKPEGWWCDGQDRHGLPLPIEEAGEIARFRKDWRLARDSEPGLSIVVPFIPDDLRAEGLLQAVAAHFFVSILRRELEVAVAGGGLGIVQLDEQNLEAACRRVAWDGLKRTKRHVPPPVRRLAGGHDRVFLDTPLWRLDTATERVMSKLYLTRIPSIFEVIDRLYWDDRRGRLRAGVLNPWPGSPGDLTNRLPLRIRQLEKTYDLVSLDADRLLELLGDEFRRRDAAPAR